MRSGGLSDSRTAGNLLWLLVSFTHTLRCQWSLQYTNTPSGLAHVNVAELCVSVCVCVGFMPHLMTRPNGQGDSSSLIGGECLCWLCLRCVFAFPNLLRLFPTDSAWQHGSPGFQELKAEVTELPAPDSSPDATG